MSCRVYTWDYRVSVCCGGKKYNNDIFKSFKLKWERKGIFMFYKEKTTNLYLRSNQLESCSVMQNVFCSVEVCKSNLCTSVVIFYEDIIPKKLKPSNKILNLNEVIHQIKSSECRYVMWSYIRFLFLLLWLFKCNLWCQNVPFSHYVSQSQFWYFRPGNDINIQLSCKKKKSWNGKCQLYKLCSLGTIRHSPSNESDLLSSQHFSYQFFKILTPPSWAWLGSGARLGGKHHSWSNAWAFDW